MRETGGPSSITIHRRLRGAALLGTIAVTLAGIGCQKPPTPIPPRHATEALEEINTNLQRLTEPLICEGSVSIRFRDEKGVTRNFRGQPTTIVYRQPQSLYMDIQDAIGGSVARVGSNDQRYWMWIDVPDLRKMIWGAWDRVADLSRDRVTFPPDDLMDSLCLRPLADIATGGAPAALRVDGPEGGDQRLIYIRADDDGAPIGLREVVLTPRPPHYPTRIIDRGANGRVTMDAQIEDYQLVPDAGGLMTPRHYVVTWPESNAQLDLRISRAKFRQEVGGAFEFPSKFNGVVEPLDGPAPPTQGAP